MNCKPGDLAYIVRSEEGNSRRFVTVEFDSRRRDHNDHWWVCTSTSDVFSYRDGMIRAGQKFLVADSTLRPIRDPGDDAVDETIQRLGKPKGVTA